MSIIITGDQDKLLFYYQRLLEDNYEPVIYTPDTLENNKILEISHIIIVCHNVFLLEEILNIIARDYRSIPVIPILADNNLKLMDLLYSFKIKDIIMHYDAVSNYRELLNYLEPKKVTYQPKDKYIINYFENYNILIIEITGPLIEENFSGFKLLFKQYLQDKKNRLLGIIYIFNNVDVKTVKFSTIWPLFRFWDSIGINYFNIYFLSSDTMIAREIKKCYGDNGLMQFKDIFEAVKMLIPEFSKKDEQTIFNFSSELLKSPGNTLIEEE